MNRISSTTKHRVAEGLLYLAGYSWLVILGKVIYASVRQ